MTQKAKGKSHPFAGHLRPNEEVLWMSPQSEDGLWSQIKIPFRMLLTIVGFIAVMAILKDINNILNILVVTAGIMGLFSIPILLWSAFEHYMNPPQPQRIYAVTNERLLYYHLRDIMSIPLEDIPTISLFRGEGTKGTFNFGVFFPMWPDVKNAVRVKRLMEEAREKRQQDLAV